MKFFKKRSNFIITGIVLAAIIGGALYFTKPSAADQIASPELQTAKVRTGDLVITANGAGTIVPAAQVDIGFRTNGVVAEVNASLGQQVHAGDILARLEDASEQNAFAQAEANLNALFSPAGIAEYQIMMANAQDAYDTAVTSLQYYISPDVYYWETKVIETRQTLDTLKGDANATDAMLADGQKAVERAENNLKAAQARYVNDYTPAVFTYTWIDEETRDEITEVVPPSPTDIILVRATLEQARLALTDAQAALEIVQSGERSALEQSFTAADGTALAKINGVYLAYENSRIALENMRLIVPFDGSVVGLNIIKGQTVGSSPVVAIATTNHLLARFYLDETDIEKAAAGMQVTFTFDAYPDATVTGEIISVEPVLQIVDSTPVVVVWASLPDETPFSILSGMTVEAEVIAAESNKTLIVPLQALRELTSGSFAVFVVQQDGSLEMTPVTVGLRDFANAEILSGLNVGDVVSTGTVETK
jgi:RND family efflux transporter MFP subunit